MVKVYDITESKIETDEKNPDTETYQMECLEMKIWTQSLSLQWWQVSVLTLPSKKTNFYNFKFYLLFCYLIV